MTCGTHSHRSLTSCFSPTASLSTTISLITGCLFFFFLNKTNASFKQKTRICQLQQCAHGFSFCPSVMGRAASGTGEQGQLPAAVRQWTLHSADDASEHKVPGCRSEPFTHRWLVLWDLMSFCLVSIPFPVTEFVEF